MQLNGNLRVVTKQTRAARVTNKPPEAVPTVLHTRGLKTKLCKARSNQNDEVKIRDKSRELAQVRAQAMVQGRVQGRKIIKESEADRRLVTRTAGINLHRKRAHRNRKERGKGKEKARGGTRERGKAKGKAEKLRTVDGGAGLKIVTPSHLNHYASLSIRHSNCHTKMLTHPATTLKKRRKLTGTSAKEITLMGVC
jgi:hypothetical protein